MRGCFLIRLKSFVLFLGVNIWLHCSGPTSQKHPIGSEVFLNATAAHEHKIEPETRFVVEAAQFESGPEKYWFYRIRKKAPVQKTLNIREEYLLSSIDQVNIWRYDLYQFPPAAKIYSDISRGCCKAHLTIAMDGTYSGFFSESGNSCHCDQVQGFWQAKPGKICLGGIKSFDCFKIDVDTGYLLSRKSTVATPSCYSEKNLSFRGGVFQTTDNKVSLWATLGGRAILIADSALFPPTGVGDWAIENGEVTGRIAYSIKPSDIANICKTDAPTIDPDLCKAQYEQKLRHSQLLAQELTGSLAFRVSLFANDRQKISFSTLDLTIGSIEYPARKTLMFQCDRLPRGAL